MSVEATPRSIVKTRIHMNTVGDVVRCSNISLPRISCVDGDFTPKNPHDVPIKRQKSAIVENSTPPVDWVGRPMGRKFGTRVESRPYTPPPPPVVEEEKSSEPRWVPLSSPPNANDILNLVVHVSGKTLNDLRGPFRQKSCTHWRQIAAYLIRKHRPVSTCAIGRILGNRDHSTILYSIAKVENNPAIFKADIERVEALL